MRLLLPMAYTIAFVMETATYANGKPSNPDKNYTYRLLELDVEPDSQAHTQPTNNDYTDNSYQQSIIPRRTHSAYAAAAGSNNKEGDNQDQKDDRATRITTKLKKSNNRRPMRNGNQWSSEKVEIPDDFRREISQLRIPRRVNKKKKLKSSSKKRRQQKANADSDMGADMDLDMDMDVNVDMDLDVGEEIKLGTDEVDADKDGDSSGGEHKNKNRNTGQKYSKGRKQGRRKKPKAKTKENQDYDSNTSSSSSNASGDEDDSNRNSENGDGGGGGAEDDDENNHQEEEEEVEEKKEKVHKVTIKKKRPYVNSTKSTAGSTTSAATKQNGTPILHSHSHDFSKLPYQNLIGIPNQNKKGNIKANTQNVNSGSSSGGGVNMVSANAAAAAALKALQKHKNNGGTQQPHQNTKPVRPLISQENAAIALNPNHQENTGNSNAVDSSAIRKGIKPRDVNLILRTKNSPRILIRRYKPLFGVYPVGVGLNSLGQRKLLGVGVYHRPHKTRKKSCKRCKKRRGKHKFYGNTYPALTSDVETLQSYSQSLPSANQVTPTPCAPHKNGQNYLNGAFSDAFSASPSPLQTSAFGGSSGAAHPWYAIRGGQSSPFGSSDDDDHGSGGSNTFSPYNFSPNRFEYVDENVISPRLPSQPVNTYLRMPLASFGGGGAISGDGSARSNDNGNSNIKDNSKGSDDMYETLPLLYSTEAPVQVDSSNQAMAAVTPKEQEENEDQGDNEGQAAIEEDDQQQQRIRRKKPQRGKKTTAESSPVYEVHETEYEPVTGHENVEDLAAVHQIETDASLFPEEQGDHLPHSRRSQDVENDASSADQYNQQLAKPEPEEKEDEKEDEEFQEYDYFDNEAQKQPANEQPDDEEVDQGDDQEEQQQQDYGDGDGNAEEDSAIENEIENENAQSAKLFDIPNADQWSYEMSESES